MNVLISGASSGLGQYLKEFFKADSFDREWILAPRASYDLIVHCAFNITSNVKVSKMPLYVEDTIGLTEWLLKIPHKKFVYISSAAVYPADGKTYAENSVFNTGDTKDLYGLTKLMCEGMVSLRSENSLILRPTYMLGPYIYKNCLTELLFDDHPHIVLQAQSEFNYILHEDIAGFIRTACDQELMGIYNLAASKTTTLQEVADHLGKAVSFGTGVFKMSQLKNNKAASISSVFKYNSLENAVRFYNSINSGC